MEHFTPVPSLFGGILIGVSASLLLLWTGKEAGISGIVSGLLSRSAGDMALRVAFLLGLLAGGAALLAAHPSAFPATSGRPLAVLAVAGLLVGYGTRLGNGCTSGHGVCGLSRGSARSFAATVTFMLTGALSAFAAGHLLGGAR